MFEMKLINHEKTSDKCKVTDILPNSWLVSFKSVKVMKEKGKTETLPD